MWNKDEIKGKGKQIEGTLKETFGHLTDNPKLEKEGKLQQAEGEVQEALGKALHKVNDAVKGVEKVLSGK